MSTIRPIYKEITDLSHKTGLIAAYNMKVVNGEILDISGNRNKGIIHNISSFNPIDVDNMMFWYDSNLGITKDGENRILQWDDQSGNGYNLVQADDAKKPLLVADQLNGYPGVQFDGINDYLSVAFGTTHTQPLTIFLVFKEPTYAINDRLYSGISSAARTALFVASNKYTLYAGTQLSSTKATGESDFLLSSIIWNGANTAIFFNGVAKGSGNAGTRSLTGFILGSAYSAGGFGWSDVMVIAAIGYDANVGDRILIENYLNDKYLIY